MRTKLAGALGALGGAALAAIVLAVEAQNGPAVAIDNFTFNPHNLHGEGRFNGDLDQQG